MPTMILLACVLIQPPAPFGIEVVDLATGRGVPLVELRTVDQQRFYTDSAGRVAIAEPDLFGQKVHFTISSPGYSLKPDGFGIAGRTFDVTAGGRAKVELERVNLAERLYRVTGAGIYRDSVLLGEAPPTRAPLMAAQVVGCDSVMTTIYRGKMWWMWGDTARVSYPLGNFHMTGATTPLAGPDGPDLDVGINFDYFTRPDGFVKPMAELPGAGPTWLSGPLVLKDKDGRERMFAGYVKVKPPLEAYERGLAEYDDEAGQFRRVKIFPDPTALFPSSQGHAVRHAEPNEQEYFYFCQALPLARVLADPEALADPARYEGYSPLATGTRPDARQLVRDADGKLAYAWRSNTPPLTHDDQERFIASGLMKPEEALIRMVDADTGRTVKVHNGSVAWNAFRKRWVAIFTEVGGSSFLGEVYYAEAPTLVGPWERARKVVTHDKMSFYNPKHHPEFDRDGGRIIFFEGTYTQTFSGNPDRTPRYEYNQVMYKLDLGDPRVVP